MNILLQGIVGSTAYGLAGPDSDVDRLGMFAVPTIELCGLRQPDESHVTTGDGPDITLHEAGKYARLALGANPTVMELLWLDSYEVRSDLGDELIAIRSAFLCDKKVRDAYLGYATQQFRKLETRGDGSFSADTRKRTAKHARHLMRLCHQGFTLYDTGRIEIRLENPQAFLDFGERVAGGDIDAARQLMARYEAKFDECFTPLPAAPDAAAVESWLLAVRRAYWEAPSGVR